MCTQDFVEFFYATIVLFLSNKIFMHGSGVKIN